jgi:hypothetical protein
MRLVYPYLNHESASSGDHRKGGQENNSELPAQEQGRSKGEDELNGVLADITDLPPQAFLELARQISDLGSKLTSANRIEPMHS